MPGDAEQPLELRLTLEPETGADEEEVDRLGRQLRAELAALDVDSITPLTMAEPPQGAKAGEVASLLDLLITMSGSGGVLVTVLATLQDWLGRRSAAHTVKLTIDGDVLELDGATSAERSALVETFVRRHGGV
ncbi:hypothetical protein SAMN04488107_2956 [Geodermatophilus saharensis]|uniref:Uncharacterized protein n=1 Tax=Geodermatophilus saharensis TaxID=1137994 RepID=A0A239FEH0_9ACTN|nr:hypothetical protein [Geodermatophilus saharensis]SNS54572.1 hypothetical protein SAMN04488107_2956 [Geodermatophilus saharensis]